MALVKTRFSLVELLLFTAAVAVFCVVLTNENRWLRAVYVTAALGFELRAVIMCIFARGERRAFALGYIVGTLFCVPSAYAAAFTLPYLLTIELQTLLKNTVGSPPSDEHFAVVMVVFWVVLTGASAGYLARWWFRSVNANLPTGTSVVDAQPS